jgi:hypothetical protein
MLKFLKSTTDFYITCTDVPGLSFLCTDIHTLSSDTDFINIINFPTLLLDILLFLYYYQLLSVPFTHLCYANVSSNSPQETF